MRNFAPDSALTEAAARYEAASGRKYRNGSNSCRTFDRLMGSRPVESLTWELLQEFIGKARERQLAESSITRCIGDLKTVFRFVTGGRIVKPVEPKPEPEPIADPANVPICRWAVEYRDTQEIVRRELLYSANRFVRIQGPVRIGAITTEMICQFRRACVNRELRPATIESSISDILTLVKAATGAKLDPGKRLRIPRPVPKPVTLKTLEAVWPHLDEWIQQWCVLTFWTGLRLADALRLQISLTDKPPDVLQWTANKTGHVQQWPVVAWLEPWLVRRASMKFRKATDFAFRKLRQAIENACIAADLPTWQPKHLRQFSLSQWMRTNAAAGQIIHGCGLNGVLKHYIDPMTILEEAAGKISVPSCFRPGRNEAIDPNQDLSELFSRLDDRTRAVMVQTLRAVLGPTA